VPAKSTDKVGFPFGCPEQFRLPRVVHSLFKEYHSCARSFSPLAPLSLSPLARRKRLTTPLLPPPTLLPPPPTPLPPLRTLPLKLLLLPPTLLLLPPTPRLPLLRTLLLLLRTLPRRCNLRRTAKDWGAGATSAPFSFATRLSDRLNLSLPCRHALGTLPA
jgi:hypothetical protein